MKYVKPESYAAASLLLANEQGIRRILAGGGLEFAGADLTVHHINAYPEENLK